MPVITLKTKISAPIEVVFDLSRSIDLHKISTAHTNEKAVAGRTTGLINLGETVTWKAKHLGFTQKLTTQITAFEQPYYFVDEMVNGTFQSFKHEHIFSEDDGFTLMTDVFDYKSPFGILGIFIDFLFLKRYMANLLIIRNLTIKEFAEETSKYKKVLP
jgi:ligand-binding SRPBCC domain-containing protein